MSRIRSGAWLLGGGLAGLGGVLLTPITYLSPDTMDSVLIVAFAAAVIGGLRSFYGVVIGGFAVAMTSNLIANYLSLDYREVLVYSTVLLFLWLRPQGLPGEIEGDHATSSEGERASVFAASGRRRGGAREPGARVPTHGPARLARSGSCPRRAAAWSSRRPVRTDNLLNLTTWLTYFIAVAGRDHRLLRRPHLARADRLHGDRRVLDATPARWPTRRWPFALLIAAAFAGLVGLLFEIPSLRLHGAYYAVATLALALMAPLIADKWRSVTGGVDGIAVPYTTWDGQTLTSEQIYYVFAGIASAVLLLLLLLRNSHIGRSVVAMRDAPHGAASLGLASGPRRVLAAGLGAGLGGLAGAMGAMSNNVVTSSGYGLRLGSRSSSRRYSRLDDRRRLGRRGDRVRPCPTQEPAALRNQALRPDPAAHPVLLPRRRDVADVLRRQRTPRAPEMSTSKGPAPRRQSVPARTTSDLSQQTRPAGAPRPDTKEDVMKRKPWARRVLTASAAVAVAVVTGIGTTSAGARATADPGIDTGTKTVTVGGGIATGPNASFVATTNAVKALFEYWNPAAG